MPSKPSRTYTRVQLSSPTPWIIVAVVAFAVAAVMAVFTVRFLSGSAVTTATVTQLLETTGDDGKTYYKPQYDYTAPDGRKSTDVSNSGSNPPKYTVGQQIQIRYHPANPARGTRIDTVSEIWGMEIWFGITGLGSLALAQWLRARRRKTRAAAVTRLA